MDPGKDCRRGRRRDRVFLELRLGKGVPTTETKRVRLSSTFKDDWNLSFGLTLGETVGDRGTLFGRTISSQMSPSETSLGKTPRHTNLFLEKSGFVSTSKLLLFSLIRLGRKLSITGYRSFCFPLFVTQHLK